MVAMMAKAVIDERKYGKLLAKTLPKVIENDEEFDAMVAKLEELTFKKNPTPEDEALASLLETLVMDYDDKHHEMPKAAPHEVVQHLLEQKNLKQKDLVPVIGSRAQVSDLVNGKRGISKAQARKLAEFFHVSADLFI